MPQNSRYLDFRGCFASAAVIYVMSIFSQWLNWYIYDKTEYGWGIAVISPLILCLIYHFIQLDAGKHNNFSRRFFFLFSVAIPLISFAAVIAAIALTSPEHRAFKLLDDSGSDMSGKIALWAGRIVFTSLYMLIFAVIDIPFLKKSDEKEKSE